MTAPSIRAVLFDKDGTLVDYDASWSGVNLKAVAFAAAGDAGLADRLTEVAGIDAAGRARGPGALIAAGSAGEIAEAFVAAGARFDPDELATELDRLFLAGAADMVPVGDLPALLGRLAEAGLRLGIASSDGAAAVAAFAERVGILDLLDFVSGWDSGNGPKQGGGPARAFAAAIGVAPAEIAVVGDTDHDMAMGRSAGAGLVVGVLTGTGTRASLGARADAVIVDISGLAGLLAAAALTPRA